MILRDGTRINVWLTGQASAGKPAVVLIHGDGQNHTIWKRIEAFFISRGHPVLSYDLPGHGLSEPYKKPVNSFRGFAETLREILITYRIMAPLVVGNSSGGMIAIEYAARFETSGVVLISSSCRSPVKHTPSVGRMIDSYLESSGRYFERQRIFDYEAGEKDDHSLSSAALRYTNPVGFRCNLAALRHFDATGELRRISSPVLALRGVSDPFVTEDCMARLSRGVKRSRVVALEGQGHNVLLQAPEQVLREIESNYDFLVQE